MLSQVISRKIRRLLKLIIANWLLGPIFAALPKSTPNFNHPIIGINFIGFYQGILGLGQALRIMVLAAQKSNIDFRIVSISLNKSAHHNKKEFKSYTQTSAIYPINCISINPDALYRLPIWLNYSEWAKRYNIGHWFWELPYFPKSWLYALSIVDEIWVNSTFNLQTMQQVCNNVHLIPLAIEFDLPNSKLNKAYFDLPNYFTFLFSFDFNSAINRKNPQAVIESFALAFPDHNTSVNLVIKLSNSKNYPEQIQNLLQICGKDKRIRLIESSYSTEEMRGLINTSDCYISLHRAEGFGLGMAEAMYLGKPVIATGYSGNMEFMNSENACLIPYTLVPLEANEYIDHRGQTWANPSIKEAAKWMQILYLNPALGKQIGSKAAAYMRANHSSAKMGQAIATRIEQIKQTFDRKSNKFDK